MAHTGAQLSGSWAQLSGSGAQLSGLGAQLSAISAYLHTSYLGAQLSASLIMKSLQRIYSCRLDTGSVHDHTSHFIID